MYVVCQNRPPHNSFISLLISPGFRYECQLPTYLRNRIWFCRNSHCRGTMQLSWSHMECPMHRLHIYVVWLVLVLFPTTSVGSLCKKKKNKEVSKRREIALWIWKKWKMLSEFESVKWTVSIRRCLWLGTVNFIIIKTAQGIEKRCVRVNQLSIQRNIVWHVRHIAISSVNLVSMYISSSCCGRSNETNRNSHLFYFSKVCMAN